MNVRSLPAAGKIAGAVLGAAVLQAAGGGGGLQPQGAEFQLTRGIPGDQVNPAIVLDSTGGLMVWQDADVDGQGLGIAGIRLATGGEGPLGTPFRVNQEASGDQENPAVARLADGQVFVVWQGGSQGFQRIRGRVMNIAGTPVTGDIAISSGAGELQSDPVIVSLADGSVMVAWSSYRQDGSFSYDVYGRHFSAAGVALADEFRLNSVSGMNRRSPALTALPDGGFLAAWVAERQIGIRDNLGGQFPGPGLANIGAPVFEVAVVARRFAADGSPSTGDGKISDSSMHASHPVLTTLPGGNVVAAWTRKDSSSSARHYDVACRSISSAGEPIGPESLINSTVAGDQYRPRLAKTARGVLAIWTSMGQDGSWEGVFGRWLDAAGTPVGDEIPINGQTGGGQILPAVTGSPDGSLVVAWSSNLPRTGFEVFAQRYLPFLLRVEAAGRGVLKLRWPTGVGGAYQLQSSIDGGTWTNIGGSRYAPGNEDSVEIPAAGQIVLYRVLRAR